MGSVCSAEAQAESDAAALAAAASGAPSSSSACDALLAKLDELMDFLRFAKLPTASFRGVVTFMFRASDADKNDIACIRTVDMREELTVLETALAPTDAFAKQVAVVHVSLADFLFMYSGEASAAEIAGMCMSGRVSVAWSAYSKLKAFAESFDFSSDKWDAYYAQCDAMAAAAGTTATATAPPRSAQSLPPCEKACCRSSSREDIDANWLLVADATATASTGGSNGTGTGACANDWQVVTDCKCYALPKEQRAEMEQVFGVQQLDEWLAHLWSGHIKRSNDALQQNVRKSLHDLKQMTGKLFVSMEV